MEKNKKHTLSKYNGLSWGALALLLCLLALPLAAIAAVQHEEVTTGPVAAGVTSQTFIQDTDLGQLKVFTLHIDLGNPYVKIETLIGADNTTFGQRSSVLSKARQAGAVAAINGDFFNLIEGLHPLGLCANDGKLLTSPMLRDDMYSFVLSNNLEPVIDLFSFQGEVMVTPAAADSKTVTYPLYGINKPHYLTMLGGNGDVSDRDALLLYNSTWGQTSRGAQSGYPGWVEVVVDQGVVKGVGVDQPGVPIPAGGYVLAGHGGGAQFLLDHCTPGVKVDFNDSVTPGGDQIQCAVGGQALLVDKGQPLTTFTQDIAGHLARSAVGFSQDGKSLYLVAVEKSSESCGMTQGELAAFMAERLGVWRALNLDGGGSTTLVQRPLGEASLVAVNHLADDYLRPVPTALGVISTAPQGNLQGLVIRGAQEILAGLDSSYQVAGYDQYFNPVSLTDQVSWRLKSGLGTITEGVLRPAEGGNFVLEATCKGISKEYQVRVLGSADLSALEVMPGELSLDSGAPAVNLQAKLQGKDGRSWTLPASAVQWDQEGMIGTVSEGVFTPGGKDASGKIRAQFLNLTRDIPVTIGTPVPPDVEQHWAKEQIRDLIKRGIVKGYQDGSFRPEQSVTRGEFVTVLAKAFNLTTSGVVHLPFKDQIPAWALPGVEAAWYRDLVGGYPDGTFKPGRVISRAELAALMVKVLKLPAVTTKVNFYDSKAIPDWAAESVQRAAAAGLVQGSNGNFRPAASATRAEMAAIIEKALALSRI